MTKKIRSNIIQGTVKSTVFSSAIRTPRHRRRRVNHQPAARDHQLLWLLLIVSGDQHGLYSGQLSVISNQVTFMPDTDYLPGELLTVTLTAGIQSTGGAPLVPYTLQFLSPRTVAASLAIWTAGRTWVPGYGRQLGRNDRRHKRRWRSGCPVCQ